LKGGPFAWGSGDFASSSEIEGFFHFTLEIAFGFAVTLAWRYAAMGLSRCASMEENLASFVDCCPFLIQVPAHKRVLPGMWFMLRSVENEAEFRGSPVWG
jgi:hypothetical protein